MARLIDADKINYHEHTECMGHGDFETVRTVTDKEIEEIPTAEPLPMVHEAYIGDDGEWHSSVFYGIENEDVTHWMPMPKTPKEDA